jgi:hypothetical protein
MNDGADPGVRAKRAKPVGHDVKLKPGHFRTTVLETVRRG